ncbi:MAG: hypothetical protein C0501_02820 [Isosphaera sp.]|nr:hypothetical protein [Isosphaera sp.]
MPITLGCPGCGKRFRARDESAGKRVKCPYCAAAVPVPSADEAANARAQTAAIPTPTPRPAPPLDPPPPPARPAPVPPARPAPVASPDDWGAADPPTPPVPAAPASPFPAPADGPRSGGRAGRPAPVPAAARRGPRDRPAADGTGKTPDQLAAPGWRKTRTGLFWVLLGVLLLALPGFVGFAKAVSARAGAEWPTGPGKDWVEISGYVNTDDPNAVRLSKEELLDLVVYGVPVLLGLVFVAFGRATCGAAPRSSGAKGLFACSGLFTFLALAALSVAAVSDKLQFRPTYLYTSAGFVAALLLAEFWFLTGVAAAGVALRRPRAARAVGVVGFAFALAALAATVGWRLYVSEYRPAPATEDTLMYEQAGVMLGWLLVVGLYWRAVGALRGAIADFLTTVEEG